MSRIFAFPKAPRCFNFLTNVSLVTKLYFFEAWYGWFVVVVTALVTSTKLNNVEPG